MIRTHVRNSTPSPGVTFSEQLALGTAKLASETAHISPSVEHSVQVIFTSYGDLVSVHDKGKFLYKFGRNRAINTSYQTLQPEGGDETYATDNVIDKISSSNSADTQKVIIEGHTIDSQGNLTFVVQEATLAGQTETAIPTPLARCTRAYNNSATTFAGDIYIYEDDTVSAGVPQTAANIHLKVVSGDQSEKASTSISYQDYFILTEVKVYCFDKSSEIIEMDLEIRRVGVTNQTFRRIFSTSAADGQPTNIIFEPPLIIPKNHDVRMRAKSAGASADVGGALNGYLAKVV